MSTAYATIIGQRGHDGKYSSSSTSVSISASIPRVGIIKFTAPEFSGVSTSVDIYIATGNSYVFRDQPVGVALCRSEANAENYVGADQTVEDENQLAVTIANMSMASTEHVNFPTEKIISGKTYYVILWIPASNTRKNLQLDYENQHEIMINYDHNYVHVDNGTEYIKCRCYIDNGTSWDLAAPYIDDGTTWNLY